jgi:hypothetical protein
LRNHRSLAVTALAFGAVAAAGSAHAETSATQAFSHGGFAVPALAAALPHTDVSPQWTQSTNGAYSFTVPDGLNTIVASLTGGGGTGGTGFFDWHGGAGGAPGSPLPATRPANAGHGGDGANGGAVSGYPGNDGIDGCVVLSC